MKYGSRGSTARYARDQRRRSIYRRGQCSTSKIKCPHPHRQVVSTKNIVDTIDHTSTLNAAINRPTGGSDSTRRGIVPKKTMDKASKLVEVIRACHVNILLDLYLIPFCD